MITHTLNVIPNDINNIIITKHCIDRIIARFKLLIPTNFNNPKDLPQFLKKQILNGYIERKFEFSPFYTNKNESRFATNTIIIKTKICIFIASWDKNDKQKLIVKTAVRRP